MFRYRILDTRIDAGLSSRVATPCAALPQDYTHSGVSPVVESFR